MVDSAYFVKSTLLRAFSTLSCTYCQVSLLILNASKECRWNGILIKLVLLVQPDLGLQYLQLHVSGNGDLPVTQQNPLLKLKHGKYENIRKQVKM